MSNLEKLIIKESESKAQSDGGLLKMKIFYLHGFRIGYRFRHWDVISERQRNLTFTTHQQIINR